MLACHAARQSLIPNGNGICFVFFFTMIDLQLNLPIDIVRIFSIHIQITLLNNGLRVK